MSKAGWSGLAPTFCNGNVRCKGLLAGGVAFFLTGVAAAQVSQEPAASAGSDVLQEVVVTAEKRTERLQDAPLAVSAVSGGQLSDMQLTQSANLVSAVPSLTFQQGANPQNASFRIRGIGTSLFGVGTVSSVAVVLDGVPAARQAQSFFNFADIQRIEVLRGPQGTLFGEGASAGVINVVTERPSREFEGLVNTTIAQGDEQLVNATVSGPVSDSVALRLTSYYDNIRGIMREVGTDDWENGNQDWGTRAKMQWNAADNLTFLLTASFDHAADNCCASVLVNATNPAMIRLSRGITASPWNRNVSDDRQTFSNSKQQFYTLEGDLDLGAVTLTSITGYQKYYLLNNNEADIIPSAVPVYVGGTSGAAFSQYNINGGTIDLHQASQELRLSNSSSGRFNYVAGIYLQNLLIDRGFTRRRAYCAAGTSAQLGLPCPPKSYQSYVNWAIVRSNIQAAFSQVDYRLVGGLKALAGLRVQHENIMTSGGPGGPLGTGALVPGDSFFGGTVAGRVSTADTAVSGKAGLQYEFSRTAQVYATYTRGFKGAGFNASPTTDYATQRPVNPEHVNAYEVGFKGLFWNGLLTLDTALFLEDYSSLQVQVATQNPDTGLLIATQTNAGTSNTKGFELESTLRPLTGLSLITDVTLAKTSIDLNGLGCPLEFQSTSIATGNPQPGQCYTVQGNSYVNVRDAQLPASPKWRVSFTPRYQHDLGSRLLAFGQVNVNYQSAQVFDLTQDPLLRQNGYTLVDLSLGLSTNDDRYGVTFFVKNLFNESYFTNMAHAQLLATAAHPSEIYANIDKESQRYFGATLQMRF
jgi:iron complex outermembrane recepter protein